MLSSSGSGSGTSGSSSTTSMLAPRRPDPTAPGRTLQPCDGSWSSPASLALVAGLSACGDDPVPAIDLVRTATAATVDAETARVEVTLGGQLDGSAELVGRLDGTEVEGTLQVSGFEVEARVVDGITYVDLPFGDGWIGIDLSQHVPQAGQVDVAGALQGTGILRALEDVTEVRAEGDEVIDGVETAKYSAVVDVAAQADRLPPKLAEAVRNRADGTVPVTIWIDGDDLLRRVVVEDGTTLRLQIDVTDLGVPVDVEAPPADEVRMIGG